MSSCTDSPTIIGYFSEGVEEVCTQLNALKVEFIHCLAITDHLRNFGKFQYTRKNRYHLKICQSCDCNSYLAYAYLMCSYECMNVCWS